LWPNHDAYTDYRGQGGHGHADGGDHSDSHSDRHVHSHIGSADLYANAYPLHTNLYFDTGAADGHIHIHARATDAHPRATDANVHAFARAADPHADLYPVAGATAHCRLAW
jgi:hypothetical protein